MATKPVRSGPDTHRIHGIHTEGKAVLFGVHGAPSETMTRIGNCKSDNRKVKSEKRNSKYEIRKSLAGGNLPGSLSGPSGESLTHRLAAVCALCACSVSLFLWSADGLRAQDLDKPAVNIDEDVTAFAFAPDGRVVYSVRRMYRNKKYDMQRDDLFLRETGGRTKRIFQGEHFTVMKPVVGPEW